MRGGEEEEEEEVLQKKGLQSWCESFPKHLLLHLTSFPTSLLGKRKKSFFFFEKVVQIRIVLHAHRWRSYY